MIKNAEFSGYYFYMKMKIKGNIQICISVPLRFSKLKKVINNCHIVVIKNIETAIELFQCNASQ